MRIRYTNPTHAKYNTIKHIDNATGKTLIALDEAEALPYTGYVDRLASGGHTNSDANDAGVELSPAVHSVNPPFVDPPTWGVTFGQFRGLPHIIWAHGSEVTRFSAPTYTETKRENDKLVSYVRHVSHFGCPESVVKQFEAAYLDFLTAPSAHAAAKEQALQSQVKSEKISQDAMLQMVAGQTDLLPKKEIVFI
jgi:hypothetical protein